MSKDVAAGGLLARIDESIGSELRDAQAIFRCELESCNPYLSDVLSHVTRFRGKRLRPILLFLSAKATGGINENHTVLAAVIEMVHTATLVHDDVLDDAVTRRHVASVNSRWDNQTSILFGDYLFTHAFHLASTLEDTLACRLIGRATNKVCEGELAQIHERGNAALDEQSYLRIIDGKTAELCAVSCRLGALFAEADATTADSLERYGRELGIAFQIADDMLDLLGDESTIGKSLGSDLEKQKLTLPLIRLLDQASAADSDQIRQLLAHPDDYTRSQLQPFIARSDAIEYSHQRAGEHADKARRQLERLPASPARQMLEEVAEFAIQRTF